MANAQASLPVKGEVTPVDGGWQTVEVEVLSEAQHRREIEHQMTLDLLKQDQYTRDRAFSLLRRCQSGSIPNLLQSAGLMHFDAIIASKVIVRLLQLNFVAHGRHRRMGQPSGYLFPGNSELVRSCGTMLLELGGVGLMEHVIEQWIPVLDREELRQAWQPLGL